MKRIIFCTVMLMLCAAVKAQTYEDHFVRSLREVLNEISARFNVRLKTNDVVIEGKMLDYANFRIRPYSVEESLRNVLAPFDYKYVKQNDSCYKIKPYEYARRTEEDGAKMLSYLSSLYSDSTSWIQRKERLRKEVREILGLDAMLAKAVHKAPILSNIRKYDGYMVQNFALETLPGLYVCGTLYLPKTKGKHAAIVCPNGHFSNGRYRESQQIRCATFARMGAISVSYDLFGWGESAVQVTSKAHGQSIAHVIQIMNGELIIDYLLSRPDVDFNRLGVTGGSGGGTQTVLLTALDERIKASAPVVSLSSYFDGGCACESGKPIQLACGGTCNAELAAMAAPRPQLIVSDGKDWTEAVPRLEYPFLNRIYTFYGVENNVKNEHLAMEGHDYSENKRRVVYDFFASYFLLDTSKVREDNGTYLEKDITIEPREKMLSFGDTGDRFPSGAIHSLVVE